MKLCIIGGANINLVGIREPEKYGTESYGDLCKRIAAYAKTMQMETDFFQSNHEGDLLDRIQACLSDGTDGIIINPGAFTHTSIALRDCLLAVRIPTVEVHITDPDTREEFRKTDYIRDIVADRIVGLGTDGYLRAVDFFGGKA